MEIDTKATLRHSPDVYQKDSVSFGPRLKQARINQNLSLDDVVGKLFILRRHLEAIEAEDFQALPQIAFARGFVVNYSKLLGLDVDHMVDSFNAAYPEDLKKKSVYDIESPLKPMGTLQRESGRSWRINPLLLLGAIGLVILAVFLLRTVSNARDTPLNSDESAVLDDLSDSEQVAGASIGTGSVNGAAFGNTGSAISLTDNSAVGTASQTTGVQSPNVQSLDTQSSDTATESQLEFWIIEDVTLNVTDATGNHLINGTKPRGGYTFTGQPPFTIQIDDVSKVSLNLDKQPINLNAVAKDNKANFTLPR